MSIATVRDTVAGYFGGNPTTTVDNTGARWTVYRTPKVPGVSTVFTATPSDDAETDYFQGLPAGTPTGVKLAIQVSRKMSVRIAIGGDHDGLRQNEYRIGLQAFGLSIRPHAEQAQDDFDAVLDGLEAFLYADRSMGTLGRTDGYLLDGGEGKAGLTIATDPAVPGADGRTWLYAEVGFNVREWIHG